MQAGGWFEGEPGDRGPTRRLLTLAQTRVIKSEFSLLCSGDRGERMDLRENSKKDGISGK